MTGGVKNALSAIEGWVFTRLPPFVVRDEILKIIKTLRDEETPAKAGCTTMLIVRAEDGTWRDVAVCSDDDADAIGENVIAAIRGTRVFQLSAKVWR